MDFDLLIESVRRGDRDAVSKLYEIVSPELRRMAHSRLGQIGRGFDLQTTALLNDAFLKLAGRTPDGVAEETAYLRIASVAMRDVLVDSIRAQNTLKRGGGRWFSQARDAELIAPDSSIETVMLADSIAELAEIHPRAGDVIVLRCFGELTREQVAQRLGVSIATVDREWALGCAWLRRKLTECEDET